MIEHIDKLLKILERSRKAGPMQLPEIIRQYAEITVTAFIELTDRSVKLEDRCAALEAKLEAPVPAPASAFPEAGRPHADRPALPPL